MLNRFSLMYNNLYLNGNGGSQLQILQYPTITQFKNATNVNSINDRKILVLNNGNNIVEKLAEKISWNNGNNFAICVGYNPAQMNTSNLDKTNELVVSLMQQCGYDGYYLFNMFSVINPNKNATKGKNNLLECIADTINCYYCQIQNMNKTKTKKIRVDLYIFWGNSVNINKNNAEILKIIKADNVYTIGTQNCRHHHPGRGVSQGSIARHSCQNPIQVIHGKIVY